MAITMNCSGVIAMDGGIGDGQRQRNGQQHGKAIMMGNGTALEQWMAQWVADNGHQLRSDAIGGNARWMAVAIMVDGSGKMAMDSGSGDEQWGHNGRQDGKEITMGNGTAVAQWMAQWAADDCHQHRRGAMGGYARLMVVAITMIGGYMLVMDWQW